MHNSNTRIKFEDTNIDMIVKMAEGNPGALSVLTKLFSDGGKIDPDNALGGFGHILNLDSAGIYGSRIWMLYKDVCKQDLIATITCIRAWQLGFLQDADLDFAIDNGGVFSDGKRIDLGILLDQVQERLPAFAP